MQHSADDLILSHLSSVPPLAHQVRKRVDRAIELDELIGAGNLGLVQAAHTFDQSKRVQFWTWAHWRVMGAMFDYARTIRGRAKRADGTGGVVRHAWLSLEDVEEPSTTLRLDDEIEEQQRRELALQLAKSSCSPRQRFVISQRLHGRTNVEIARELRVTRSAVEQLAARAITHLRKSMEETLCLKRS